MIWIFLLSMLVLIALGTPVAFALGATAIILALVMEQSLTGVVHNTITGMDKFPLLAIPFYLLLGSIMNRGSLSRRLMRLANAMIGFVPGGLGHGAVLGSMFMGGVSGSAVADSSAVGSILIKPMEGQGYRRSQSGALIGTASLLGIIIPPSIPFVLFGIATETSIKDLFLGGIVPGLMFAALLMIVVWWQARGRGDDARTPFRRTELVEAFKGAWAAVVIPVVVVFGILFGFFTPTEAGAMASGVALFLSMVFFRDVSFRDLPGIFMSAAKTTAAVFFLVGTASATAWLLTTGQVPQSIIGTLLAISERPLIVLLLINLFLLLVGCVLDLTPALLILAPILMPVAIYFGIDPIFFGVMMCINLGIGLVTPPVGTILYIMAGLSRAPVEAIIKDLIPYLAVMVFGLVLIIIFPGIVTFLPELLSGSEP
jgi:tripartite ATP-independent transporter DctM subunit